MALNALVAPLLGIDLFQGLRPLQITEIARRAERVTFRAGQMIVVSGQGGDAAFIVVGGEAVRTKGPGLAVAPEPIAVGSLIAEMSMLVETEHTSTVVALGPVRALKITRASLYEQMLSDRSLAEHLVGRINQRLHVLASELRTIDGRLALADVGPAPERPAPFLPIAELALERVRPGLETRH